VAARKPRGLHSYDASCPICSDGPVRKTAAHEVGEDAPAPHPNPNPHGVREDPYNHESVVANPANDGHTWYHGTDFHSDRDTPAPIKTLDERGAKGSHWNAHMGTHFTSLHPVAQHFANDDFSYRQTEGIPGAGKSFARVAHAHLHMANPKHYGTEEDLNSHFVSHLQNEHNMSWQDAQKTTLGHPGDHEKGLIAGFVDHLRDSGHDGLTYGNEEEGPHLHRCAIAFKRTPVSVHKWEWLHDKKEAVSGSRHPRSHEDTREMSMNRVAVTVDSAPFKMVAHVSGNQVDILHCPFCGSGAVIGRSDGTVECGFCTSVYTVQVQPQYSGFPQSVDGQPYQWPGMPDASGPGVVGPEGAPGELGPDGQPMDPNDPAAMQGATDGGIGGLPPGGPAGQAAPPVEGESEDGEEDDDDGDEGGNPFAKKKSYVTHTGAVLDADNYKAYLAIQFAANKPKVASLVKNSRRAR
jgi:hypothetical protein